MNNEYKYTMCKHNLLLNKKMDSEISMLSKLFNILFVFKYSIIIN